MAIGRTGAFATVQPIKDSIGDAMTATEDAGFKYRAEKRIEDEAKAKKEEEKDLEFKGDLEKAKAVITGNRGYDAPVIEAVGLLKSKMADDYRLYKSGKLSKLEYDIKKNNLLFQVDLLKQKSEGIVKNYATYTELLKGDKLEGGFEDRAVSLSKAIDNGHITAEIDENNNINMVAWELDENNQPVKVIEKSSISDFGNSTLNPVLKVNFQEDIEKFKKNNELGLEESIGYNKITGVKELKKGSNIDRNILAYSQAKVKDPNFLKVAYRNATGETIYDSEEISKDPDKVKKAEDWAYNQIFDSYSKEITQKEAVQRAKFEEDKRKNKEEEKKVTTAVVETPPEFTGAGIKPRDGYKTISVTGSKPVLAISGSGEDTMSDGSKKTVNKLFNNATLDAYTVVTNPSGKRQVVGLINYPDVKTSTLTAPEKNAWDAFLENEPLTEDQELTVSRITKGAEYKKQVVVLSEKDAYKYAVQLGYDNVNQMKDAAGKDIEKQPEEQKKETPAERAKRIAGGN